MAAGVKGWDGDPSAADAAMVAAARAIIAQHPAQPEFLPVILHALQDAFGFIDPAAVALIAETLNLSRAEVAGVVSFYADFRTAPAPGLRVQLCRGEACQANGCETVVAQLRDAHGLRVDEPRPEDDLAIETVYCLGACPVGPAALVAGAVLARVTAAQIAALRPEPVDAERAAGAQAREARNPETRAPEARKP